MAKNKPRWKPVRLWSLVRKRRDGTLTSQLGFKILEEWDKIPVTERFSVRPYLCGEEIRFQAPGSSYYRNSVDLN